MTAQDVIRAVLSEWIRAYFDTDNTLNAQQLSNAIVALAMERLNALREVDLDEAAVTYATMRTAIERATRERDSARRWLATTVRIARLLRGQLAESDAAFHATQEMLGDALAQLEALRCYDLDAFHDGELSPERADAFRLHLATCEACRAGLHDRMQVSALVSDASDRRRAVFDAAVAWVTAGGALAAIASAVKALEGGR